MNPTGLPELFQQPRNLNNSQEVEIIPASDPNGRFVASLDTHLLGLLRLLNLWSLDSAKSL